MATKDYDKSSPWTSLFIALLGFPCSPFHRTWRSPVVGHALLPTSRVGSLPYIDFQNCFWRFASMLLIVCVHGIGLQETTDIACPDITCAFVVLLLCFGSGLGSRDFRWYGSGRQGFPWSLHWWVKEDLTQQSSAQGFLPSARHCSFSAGPRACSTSVSSCPHQFGALRPCEVSVGEIL